MGINSPDERAESSRELGARLKAVRELNGLSQRELARRAGVTNSNISLIEQGQVSPSVTSLARLLDAVPISLSQFFAFSGADPEGGVVRAGSAPRTECPEQGLILETLSIPGAGSAALERYQLRSGADTGVDPLRLTQARVGWVVCGKLELTLGLRCYTLTEGDAFHLPEGQLFRARNPGDSLSVVILTGTG